MLKTFFNYLWSLRQQFIKYFIVGFSGVFLDLGSLIILKEYFGWWPVLAVMINQLILLVYNFSLNKYWSFKNLPPHQNSGNIGTKEIIIKKNKYRFWCGGVEMPHKQIIKYLILAGINYFISVGVMYLFNQQMNYDYRLVRLATIALMVCWNFFLYKYWVYKTYNK